MGLEDEFVCGTSKTTALVHAIPSGPPRTPEVPWARTTLLQTRRDIVPESHAPHADKGGRRKANWRDGVS